GALNIIYHERDALSFLNETALTFDLAYVDPSRRTENSQRRIELTAYSPDVRTLVPFLGRTFNRMMLKVSPMLDIDRGLQVITNVARVATVTASGEVRELLFFSAAGHTAERLLEAIDLTANRPPFSFYRSEVNEAIVQFRIQRKYVYMPGPEILYSGAFRLVACLYGLTKLHVNTHLYTSEDLQPDFPGRIFEI